MWSEKWLKRSVLMQSVLQAVKFYILSYFLPPKKLKICIAGIGNALFGNNSSFRR